jgi:hypothetical protein
MSPFPTVAFGYNHHDGVTRQTVFVVADASVAAPNGRITLVDSPLKIRFDFRDRERYHQLQAIELAEPATATAVFVSAGNEERMPGVGGLAHNPAQAELLWNELKGDRHLSRILARQFDEGLQINPFMSLGQPMLFVPRFGLAQEGLTRMFWTSNHGYLNAVARRWDGSLFTVSFSDLFQARLEVPEDDDDELDRSGHIVFPAVLS